MQSQPSLGLVQRQQLSLTPQLRQALHLLQCSSQELALEVDQALATNPLLELADDAPAPPPDLPEVLSWARRGPLAVSDDIPEVAAPPSLHAHLLQQLHTTRASARDAVLVSRLIGELDERGYLEFDPQALSLALPPGVRPAPAQWLVALRLLQSFDPVGVGARDLPECLRLQLRARAAEWEAPARALALALVDHLDDLGAGRWDRLCRTLGCDRKQLDEARAIVRKLDPRPVRAWQTEATRYVVPDLLMVESASGWQVEVNPAVERPVRLCADLVANLDDFAAARGLRERLREARILIHSLEQRRQTLLRVAGCILRHQPGFPAGGLRALRPLAQRDVALDLGLHESTVSRAVRQKYLQTPLGVFELQQFFAAGIPVASGADASARAVQALMRELLAAEPAGKPLSDMRLTQALAAQGLVIARRTVAKYREAMGVLPASLRGKRDG